LHYEICNLLAVVAILELAYMRSNENVI